MEAISKGKSYKFEQFDGSEKMIKKYHLTPEIHMGKPVPKHFEYAFEDMEGNGLCEYIKVGDWINIGKDSEDISYYGNRLPTVSNEEFEKEYVNIEEVPKYVSEWILRCTHLTGVRNIFDSLNYAPDDIGTWAYENSHVYSELFNYQLNDLQSFLDYTKMG